MYISLVALRAKHFLSIKDEITIQFPKTGLVLIQGENGAGKSSILKAIAYALDYVSDPATELVAWNSDEKQMEVQLTLEVNGNPMVLTRSKSAFKMEYLGQEYFGRAVVGKLGRIAADPSFISLMTYRSQGSEGNFGTLRPSEKQEYLNKIMALDVHHSLVNEVFLCQEWAKKELTRLSELRKTIYGNASFVKKDIEKDRALVAELTQKTKDLHAKLYYQMDNKPDLVQVEKEIQECNDLIAEYDTNLKINPEIIKMVEYRAELENKTLEAQAKELENLAKIKEEESLKEDGLRKWLTEKTFKQGQEVAARIEYIKTLKQTEENKRFYDSFMFQLKNIDKQLEELRNEKCPTCLTKIVDNEKRDAIEERILLMAKDIQEEANKKLVMINASGEIANKIKELEKEQAETSAIIAEINNNLRQVALEAQDKRSKINLERQQRIAEIQKLTFAIEKKQSDITIEKGRTIDKLAKANAVYTRAMQDYEKSLTWLRYCLDSAKDEKERQEMHLATVEEELARINAQLEQNEAEAQAVEAQKAEAEEIEAAVVDFDRLVTEDTLKNINGMANETLAKMPNAQHINVKLDTSRTTKGGKEQKSISLKLYNAGREAPYSTFSGGQKASINLAIDIAISNVISLRINKRLNWWIFDESFDGMSTYNKAQALESLKVMSQNNLILIVEHSPELTEVFDKTLYVYKENDSTKVRSL